MGVRISTVTSKLSVSERKAYVRVASFGTEANCARILVFSGGSFSMRFLCLVQKVPSHPTQRLCREADGGPFFGLVGVVEAVRGPAPGGVGLHFAAVEEEFLEAAKEEAPGVTVAGRELAAVGEIGERGPRDDDGGLPALRDTGAVVEHPVDLRLRDEAG